MPDFDKINRLEISPEIVKQIFPMKFLPKISLTVKIGVCTLSNCTSFEMSSIITKGKINC